MHKVYRFVFSLTVLLLLSCTRPQTMAMPAPTVLPTPVPGEITVLALMAPVASAGMTNGSVYFTLQNGTVQPIHLSAATTSVAERLSFHETIDDKGVMRMIAQPDGFVVPAGESLVLEPGRKHLMLENLRAPLVAGTEFTLTLTFTDADPLTLTVPVMDHGAEPMDHSKMDHGK